MKNLLILITMMGMTGFLNQASAQDQATGREDPVKTRLLSPLSPQGSGSEGWANPHIHALNVLLREKELRIHKDGRSGRLTGEQVKASLEKIRDIRRLESKYYFENGGKDITEGQKNNMLAMLRQAGIP
jgi:hypothetical protein